MTPKPGPGPLTLLHYSTATQLLGVLHPGTCAPSTHATDPVASHDGVVSENQKWVSYLIGNVPKADVQGRWGSCGHNGTEQGGWDVTVVWEVDMM